MKRHGFMLMNCCEPTSALISRITEQDTQMIRNYWIGPLTCWVNPKRKLFHWIGANQVSRPNNICGFPRIDLLNWWRRYTFVLCVKICTHYRCRYARRMTFYSPQQPPGGWNLSEEWRWQTLSIGWLFILEDYVDGGRNSQPAETSLDLDSLLTTLGWFSSHLWGGTLARGADAKLIISLESSRIAAENSHQKGCTWITLEVDFKKVKNPHSAHIQRCGDCWESLERYHPQVECLTGEEVELIHPSPSTKFQQKLLAAYGRVFYTKGEHRFVLFWDGLSCELISSNFSRPSAL